METCHIRRSSLYDMQMTELIATGKITKKGTMKNGNQWIKLDNGQLYSQFGAIENTEGQHVKINYEVNGDFKNIKTIEVLSAPNMVEAIGLAQTNREDKIVRQCALKAAVEYGKDKKLDTEQLLLVAESFYDWINS